MYIVTLLASVLCDAAVWNPRQISLWDDQVYLILQPPTYTLTILIYTEPLCFSLKTTQWDAFGYAAAALPYCVLAAMLLFKKQCDKTTGKIKLYWLGCGNTALHSVRKCLVKKAVLSLCYPADC